MAKKRKLYSDSYLMKLWREAVLNFWGNRCGFCGHPIEEELQCHHIVYRRHKILKWNWRNGIPLCYKCHRVAHTKAGEQRISSLTPFYDFLVYWEQKIFKNLFITDNDFRQEMYDDLQESLV